MYVMRLFLTWNLTTLQHCYPAVKVFPAIQTGSFIGNQCPEKSTEITINSAYNRFTF